jgi:hypothetical protein
MGIFDDVYYSFFTIIADYERENPLFKEAVKIAITPMISSPSLMESTNSESEVLGIDISVIMLNIGMYLGVPAVLIVGIGKRIQIPSSISHIISSSSITNLYFILKYSKHFF